MPIAKYFDKYPPFPDDVPLINLTRLSLSKLIENDDSESKRLFQACTETGFFVLDLRNSAEGEVMLGDAENIFHLNEKIHELNHDELVKYASKPPKSLFGYKPVGLLKHQDGTVDSIAFYNLGQDDILDPSTKRPQPDIIHANQQTFEDFFRHGHKIIGHILSHLDKQLALEPGTLASFNPLDKPSGTSLRMLRCPPQATANQQTNLIGHTDIGAVTMLFNVVGGLQILPMGAENFNSNWRYVRPEPGCAVIHLADAMTVWSGGILQSNMHRVVTPPGAQAECTRFSVAYLVRPQDSASMRRLSSRVIPRLEEGEEEMSLCAKEWQALRSAQIMLGKNEPTKTAGVRVNGRKEEGLVGAVSE